MSLCQPMLLLAVACVWPTGLTRSEDHPRTASSIPAVTELARGIDPSPREGAAAPAIDDFLRIGAARALGIETTLWPSGRAQGPPLRIVPLIAEAASRAGLPYDFLYRLLVRESGLRPDAVSPKGALGIAQFMPATALERGLTDPFDARAAVLKAAELLRDHRTRFGNLGLAAAAYNAGPGRVERWLGGAAVMPLETRAYVRAITGQEIESWSPPGRMAMGQTATGRWAGQWAALLVPSSEPAGLQPETVNPPERISGRTDAGPVVSEKWPPTKTRAVVIPRSETARKAERLVRSEQALCNLMNDAGRTCLVRQIY